MHNPDADLHTFEGLEFAMIHPHTKAGWRWLASLYGKNAMLRYDRDGTQPQVEPAFLPELRSAARKCGLIIEETVSAAVAASREED